MTSFRWKSGVFFSFCSNIHSGSAVVYKKCKLFFCSVYLTLIATPEKTFL